MRFKVDEQLRAKEDAGEFDEEYIRLFGKHEQLWYGTGRAGRIARNFIAETARESYHCHQCGKDSFGVRDEDFYPGHKMCAAALIPGKLKGVNGMFQQEPAGNFTYCAECWRPHRPNRVLMRARR